MWVNLAGNALAPPVELPEVPRFDVLSHIEMADLLGDGTGCLVSSTTSAPEQRQHMGYLRMCASGKLYLPL